MAGGDYSLDFSAANPNNYPKIIGSLFTVITGNPLPSGRDPGDDLAGAEDDTSVESLSPGNLAIGQIVPFFFRIEVDAGAPPGDSITFVAGWDTETTAGGDYGYDEDLGVLAAFVDTNDPNTVNDTDATVSSLNWSIVGTEIQGTFVIDNLDPGETVVVEAWLVLDDEIMEPVQGNTVQSRLISAETSGTVETGETINTGNQTVPLQQVGQLFSLEADLSVIKSDNPSIVTTNPDPQAPTTLQIGDQFTYTIEVTNNSDEVVANGVVLTDTLDPNVAFVSATVTDTVGFITPDTNIVHDGSANGGTITGDLQFLEPLETVTVEVTVEILDTAPTDGDDSLANGDLFNNVTVTSINDTNTANNSDIEPTDVTADPEYTISKTVTDVGGDGAGGSVDEAGDVASYEIVVTNDGN
ncbi:conserved repeat protein, partial [Xenococcus sp. PCC 7305]|uniref:DUF11 domain-containing protein n=1 Tax=Xenococcus sp. PCC 7305 TaxID=102125 RepID=UPI0002ACBF59